MASEQKKRLGLALGLTLAAVGGGASAYLTNLQLGNLLATDGADALPEYQAPPESPLAGQPVTVLPPSPGSDGLASGGSSASGFSAKPPSIGDFSSIEFRNIFDSEATGRSDVVVPEDPETEGDDPNATVSALGPMCVHVFHTLNASPQRYAWALVAKDERGTEQEIFRIGDPVFEEGSSLVRVGLRDIKVKRRDESTQTFTIGEDCEAGSSSPASKPVAVAEPSKDGVGDGIEEVGDNKFVIPSEEIDKAMGNLESLAKDARVVPHYQNGQVVGFKVFRIKAGSVYSKLGLKNGDILERVNGEELNSPEKALALYQTLRNEKGFQLDLRRRNQPLTLSYEVR